LARSFIRRISQYLKESLRKVRGLREDILGATELYTKGTFKMTN